MPRVRERSVDRQIDEWSRHSPITVVEIHPNCKFDTSADGCVMTCTLVYSVIYQLQPGYTKSEMAKPGKLPFWARGTPCIDAVDENTGRPVRVMAGMFGVPEGAPLSEIDDEPAPMPLLSPDFSLLTYSDLYNPYEGEEDESREELYASYHAKIPLPTGADGRGADCARV